MTYGVNASVPFDEPMKAWTAHGKRAGWLNEDGVATDPHGANISFNAYSAGWNDAVRAYRNAGVRVDGDALLREADRIIQALIVKSDYRLDRNEEFFAAAQWRAKAIAGVPVGDDAIAPEHLRMADALDEIAKPLARGSASIVRRAAEMLRNAGVRVDGGTNNG